MRFKNLKTGEIYSGILIAMSFHCDNFECDDCKLKEPVQAYRGMNNPCDMFCIEHPREEARLMGYEVIEEEPKSDKGKPRPSLVPPALIRGVDAIREYGCEKYHDPENWRNVEAQRYWDAALRHTLAAWNDWKAVDEESGMPHIWHLACNLAFLMQYMEENK